MKKKLAAILLFLVMVVSLSACGGGSDSIATQKDTYEGDGTRGIPLVIILGRHSNANLSVDTLKNEKVADLITQSYSYYKENSAYHIAPDIHIILSDGSPEALPYAFDEAYCVSDNSRNNMDQADQIIRQNLIDYMSHPDLRADDPEVDLIAAISEARRILNASGAEKKNLLILDTGITTAGYMDMNKIDIQSGEVSDVLGQLSPGAFPDLSGIHITFEGLGNVAPEAQDDLRNDSIFENRLIELWTAYFEKCNVTVSRDAAANDSTAGTMDPLMMAPKSGTPMLYNETAEKDQTYPFVSNVPFTPSENNIPEIPEPTETFDEEKDSSTMIYPAARLGFKGDRADFTNEETARKTVRNNRDYYQEIMNKDSECIFYVVGSVGKVHFGDDHRHDQLAFDRAKAVAQLLIEECGIPEAKLFIIDGGDSVFSWRNHNEFPNGTDGERDETAQAQNRLVSVIPSNRTSLVAELMGPVDVDYDPDNNNSVDYNYLENPVA